jgi:hypothetical protein
MTMTGRISRGNIELSEPVKLPEGTEVRVEVTPIDSDFWKGKSVEELATEQGVGPIGRLEDLAIDWPEEDSVEEFLALIREVRR